jgi:hypothetical protein
MRRIHIATPPLHSTRGGCHSWRYSARQGVRGDARLDQAGNPQRGFLELADIYNLNLSADLILSACQTGLGKEVKDKGLVGLTRGFLYGGAKGVVASLWKVDDAATASLMEEFYKELFSGRLSPAAALRQAETKIWNQRRWASPHFWGGSIYEGDWRLLAVGPSRNGFEPQFPATAIQTAPDVVETLPTVSTTGT